MKKVIGVMLYALLVVGVYSTLPDPAHASCDASCFLQHCAVGSGGESYGWVRSNGSLFVILRDPQGCQFPNNLYVSCQEQNWGCSSASSGTYKVQGDKVFAWDDKGHLRYSIPAQDFNARHQKDLAASVRTCKEGNHA